MVFKVPKSGIAVKKDGIERSITSEDIDDDYCIAAVFTTMPRGYI